MKDINKLRIGMFGTGLLLFLSTTLVPFELGVFGGACAIMVWSLLMLAEVDRYNRSREST